MGKGKARKFSLANVLAVLAALAFGIVCFSGWYFYDLGDKTKTPNSAFAAALVTVLLSVFAIGAGVFKRAGRHFTVCLVLEIVFLIALTCFTAYFAYTPFPQYFAVSEQREEINGKLRANIGQAEKMFEEYKRYAEDRKVDYEKELRTVVKGKNVNRKAYIAYGFDIAGTVRDSARISTIMDALDKGLGLLDEYKKMKDTATATVLQNSIKSGDSLSLPVLPIDAVNTVKENNVIKEKTKAWLSSLVEISKHRHYNEQTEDFEYELSFGDVESYFTTHGEPDQVSVSAAILLYVLMLTPYLSSKRSEKPTVLKKAEEDNNKNRKDTKINISAINS
jgi:hypothetical protein